MCDEHRHDDSANEDCPAGDPRARKRGQSKRRKTPPATERVGKVREKRKGKMSNRLVTCYSRRTERGVAAAVRRLEREGAAAAMRRPSEKCVSNVFI